MIDWYRARWEIEMFFHVLKNGCRIEALQLGSIEKIERALVLTWWWPGALPGSCAWDAPVGLERAADVEPDEWEAAYILNQQKV